MAAVLLGWRPDEFWAATPAELAVILHALHPDPAVAGSDDLARLKGLFPDDTQ